MFADRGSIDTIKFLLGVHWTHWISKQHE